jgi:hypothetical protein
MNQKNKKNEENFEDFSKQLVNLMSTFDRSNANKNGASHWGSKILVPFNNEGYRSADFTKDIDLLSAGCSFTFGIGLEEHLIWNNMLAEKYGFSHNSIGISGGSCMDIVFNLFKYFEKYGHPKKLLVLFPDFGRVFTYIDKRILDYSAMFHDTRTLASKSFSNDRVLPDIEDRSAKYISLPTEISNIYSLEFVYTLNSMYIKMLEIYCNSNNIDFIWFKWYPEDNIDTDGGLNGFSNMYKIDYENDLKPYDRTFYKQSSQDICHKEEKENLLGLPSRWYIAEDDSHHGVHWQIHVKELFEKALKEKGLI